MPTAPISRTRKLSVALTGFGGLDEPGPGASVAHALKQGWPSDLSISAWSYGSPANGAWLPGVVDRLQVLPPLAAGEEKVFAAIVEAHERAPVDVLIPCEADVVLIAQLADRLNEQGIRTLLPLSHHVAALTRASLPKFLHDHQVSGPFTINVPNVDDVVPLADLIGYPLYVRGVHFGQQVVYNAHQASMLPSSLTESGSPVSCSSTRRPERNIRSGWLPTARGVAALS